MWSALAGIVLLASSRILTYSLSKTVVGRRIETIVYDIVPVPFVGTAILAFVLGVSVPFLINRRVSKASAKAHAVRELGDPLVKMLFDAADSPRPVFLTLDSRKIYVGFVKAAPNLERENVNVGLLPLLSGYRDPTTLQPNFVQDYDSVYASGIVDPNDFQVAIPIGRIQSAQYFNKSTYAEFFAKRECAGEQPSAEPAAHDSE
jgi:hypothetical protein